MMSIMGLRTRSIIQIPRVVLMALAIAMSPAALPAQSQSNLPQSPPQRPAIQIPAPSRPLNPSVVITMDQAIAFARRNNPELQAQPTLVYQNREQEVTANLRPNPTLSWDAQYIPIFQPDLFSSNYMGSSTLASATCSSADRNVSIASQPPKTPPPYRSPGPRHRAHDRRRHRAAVRHRAAGQVESRFHRAAAGQLSAHRRHRSRAPQGRQDGQCRHAEDPVGDLAVSE